MSEGAVIALIIALIAHTATVMGAWIKTQRDVAEMKTDIRWLKSYATHRRRQNHGTDSH